MGRHPRFRCRGLDGGVGLRGSGCAPGAGDAGIMGLKSFVTSRLPPEARARLYTVKAAADFVRSGGTIAPRECNICGYIGPFYPFGRHLRRDAGCPGCRSLERHRLFKLFFDAHRGLFDGRDILHFAPEAAVLRFTRPVAGVYLTADLNDPRADTRLDIEAIGMAERFDTIIASHVLEHVNDRAALASLHESLRRGGALLVMIPITENLATFEDPAVTGARARELHFGQRDHVRFYGGDFADRAAAAGFLVERFNAADRDVARFGLYRGETVFNCRRP